MADKQNKITNPIMALSSYANVGIHKGGTKIAQVGASVEDLWDGEFFENWLEDERKKVRQEEAKIQEYLKNKNIISTTALNFAGGVLESVADPVSLAINAVTSGSGLITQILTNLADYGYEQYSAYNRNINDINLKDDALPIIMSTATPIVANKFKHEFEVDYGKFTPSKTKEIINDLNDIGVNTSDTSSTIKKVAEATEILKKIDTADTVDEKKILSDKLTKDYGIIGEYANSTINTDQVEPKLSSLDIVAHYAKNGEGIPQNQLVDATLKNKFGGVQGEYYLKSYLKKDLNSLIKQAYEIDKKSQTEFYTTGKKRISVEHNLDIYSTRLKNSLKMGIKQLETEFSQELYFETKNVNPFGNQLYEFSKGWNKHDFVETLQNFDKYDTHTNNILNILKTNQKNTSDIETTFNTIKIIKKRFDELTPSKNSNSNKGYQLKFFYKTNEYMAAINKAISSDDIDYLKKLSETIGLDVEVDEDSLNSIKYSMKSFGKTSKIEKTGNYSILDFPEELGILLRNDIESTTNVAKKGAFGEPKKIDEIMKKWGNGGDADNFMKSFVGFEKETYEIISSIYSEVTKKRLGLDLIEDTILKLTPGYKLNEFPVTNKYLQIMTDRESGRYLKKILESLDPNGLIDKRYKPNFYINPSDPKKFNNIIIKTTKSLFSYKYLLNLNGLGEIPFNKRLTVLGAKKLGWDLRFKDLKSSTFKLIAREAGVNKVRKAILTNNLDKIQDPILRQRAKNFLYHHTANDPIFNNPANFVSKKRYEVANKVGGVAQKLGEQGAKVQLFSDIYRKFVAEFAAKNYLLDIYGTTKNKSTPILRVLNKTLGIDEEMIPNIRKYINNLSETEFDNLIWSGKVAKDEIGRKVQLLFETASDVMGREMDPFERNRTFESDFVQEMWNLYKRYSLGQLRKTTRSIMYFYEDDVLKNRMLSMMDAASEGNLSNFKNTFEGANRACLFNFAWTSAESTMRRWGIHLVTGIAVGTSSDERTKAKIDALLSGEIFPTILDSVVDTFLNETGAGIVFGSESILGSFYNKTIKRSRRAMASDELSATEKIMYFLTSTLSPEVISRGIDNLKFKSNIGANSYGSGRIEQELWREKYRDEALEEQEIGEFPIEKMLKFALGGAISLFSLGKGKKYKTIPKDKTISEYYKNNPDEAHKLVGTEKKDTPDEVAITGATGLVELTKEITEMQTMIEILNDKDALEDDKEKRLMQIGLDIDTQSRKMSKKEFTTLSTVIAFKNKTDNLEILMLLHQFNNTPNKKAFLRSLIPSDEEYEMYQHYKNRIQKNKTKINNKIKNRKYKIGMKGYKELLEILKNY